MIPNNILNALNACLSTDYDARQVSAYHDSFDCVNLKNDHSMLIDGRIIEMQESKRGGKVHFNVVQDSYNENSLCLT